MVRVVGVSFKRAGKVYYFDPADLDIRSGMPVIVETIRGIEYAQATGDPFDIEEDKVIMPLKPVIRLGTDEDTRIVEENRKKEVEAFGIAEQKILDHQLEMKLIDVEYTFDGSKIIFYFTANGRVDFRELVKDLAFQFKTRIELKQIGVRDEAKMLGGLGPCGRPICCRAFLHDFQPVSIKMAKEQSLSLNPVKISGLCGRLMCCLKYEEDSYEQIHKESPKVGKEIQTPDGKGIVSEINVMKETAVVKMERPDQTFEFVSFPLANYDAEQNTISGPMKEEKPEPRLDFSAFAYDSDTSLAESLGSEEETETAQPNRENRSSGKDSGDGRDRRRNQDRRDRNRARGRSSGQKKENPPSAQPENPEKKAEGEKAGSAERRERDASRGRNRFRSGNRRDRNGEENPRSERPNPNEKKPENTSGNKQDREDRPQRRNRPPRRDFLKRERKDEGQRENAPAAPASASGNESQDKPRRRYYPRRRSSPNAQKRNDA